MFDLRFHNNITILNRNFYTLNCKEYIGLYSSNYEKYIILGERYETYKHYIYKWKVYFGEKSLTPLSFI